MLTLYGTRTLVTGGSRGIGLAIAEGLAEAGADVVLIHFKDGEKAEAEARRIAGRYSREVSQIGCDVGDYAAARAAVDQASASLGGLDMCICNAGICRFTPFLELTRESWDAHVATNLSGGFHVAQRAAQVMADQKRGGRIVFTTSVGAFQSNAMQTHYCATKGGVHLLALGMAIELAPHGITVNCLAPGWIHTDINDAASRDERVTKPWLDWNCPAGRLGVPQDCVGAALFFCSKESSYVTGSTVFVDGGWMSKL